MNLNNCVITLDDLIPVCENCSWASIDFETEGKHPISREEVGLGIVTDVGSGYYPMHKSYSPKFLQGILRPLIEKPVIAWNADFELHSLTNIGLPEFKHIIDPQTGLWLLEPTAELALKPNFERVTGKQYKDWKDHIKDAWELKKKQVDEKREAWVEEQKLLYGINKTTSRKGIGDRFPYPALKEINTRDIPLEILSVYCLSDCHMAAYMWFHYIRPALESNNLLEIFYCYEMPFLKVLNRMEHRGITLDTNVLAEAAKEIEADYFDALNQIKERRNDPEFNPNSPEQLKKWIFEELGYKYPAGRERWSDSAKKLKPSERTWKNLSLDQIGLKILAETYGDKTDLFYVLQDLSEKGQEKELYTDGLPKHLVNNKLHTSFNRTGTATGRLSSSEPNLQNIKATVKKAFKPRPGFLLGKIDLSQAELRIIAERTNDPEMLSVYNNNGDIHEKTGQITGVKERKVNKTINFSMSYEAGYKKVTDLIRYKGGVPDVRYDQVKEWMASYFSGYKRINPWKEEVVGFVKKNGYVQTRLGRYRYLPELQQEPQGKYDPVWSHARRQAINQPIQGDVADIAEIVMIKLDKLLSDLGGGLLLQVHDEFVFEFPNNLDGDKIVQSFIEICRNSGFKLNVPMDADGGFGPSWGECVSVK